MNTAIPLKWPSRVVLVLAVVASGLAIIEDSGVVPAWPMDQSFAQIADLRIRHLDNHWEFHYPRLQHSGGITATVTVGIYKLIVPTTELSLNWHIRIFAMFAFLSASYLLATTYIRNEISRVLAMATIACSGFQFIQPSSELIASAYLGLYLVGVRRLWPLPFLAGLLISFGLCKVELFLAAAAIGVYWYLSSTKGSSSRWRIPVYCVAWTAFFVLPSIAVNRENALMGGRAFEAFGQHYAVLFASHQYVPLIEDPWTASKSVMNAVFPTAHSTPQLVLQYPRQYLDFMALSLVQSALSLCFALKGMLLPIVVLLGFRWWPPTLRSAGITTGIALVAALTPAVLFAFIHIRYIARFFPIIVCMIIAACSDSPPPTGDKVRGTMWGGVLLTLVLEVISLGWVYRHSHGL